MNYQNQYDKIINKAKLENRKKLRKNNNNYIYYERHHIIPRCIKINETKENQVLLTAREHYICHKLLFYIYPGNRKIIHAFIMISFDKRGNRKISSKDYAYAKELDAKLFSEYNTNNKKGKSYEEQMIKIYGKDEGISRSKQYKTKIYKNTEGVNNPMYNLSLYDSWCKKFGKEIANNKYKEWLQNIKYGKRISAMKRLEKKLNDYISSF